nr:hypothetical protein CFP56_12772 [Quercus suber]
MYFVKIQIDKCSDIYNLELLMVSTFVSIGACIVLSEEFERMEYLAALAEAEADTGAAAGALAKIGAAAAVGILFLLSF